MADVRVSVPDDFMLPLVRELGMRKPWEVAQEALTILNWIVEERKAGRLICSCDADGKSLTKLSMASLNRIEKRAR